MKFIKNAGFFRHDVDIPARIAEDGKQRIHHFHCLASENITETMLAVLGLMYGQIKSSSDRDIERLKRLASEMYRDAR